MSPEETLAAALASLPKTKTAQAFDALTSAQLSVLLKKEANGDMLQFFQDHPEKLREKREQMAAKNKEKQSEMEKTSAAEKIAMADQWGRELAHQHFEKLSAHSEHENPGFIAGQRGAARAMARAPGSLLADKELIKSRMKGQLKGALKGGGAGAALGAAVGHLAKKQGRFGALIGGSIGSLAGQLHGGSKVDKEYLAKKGIKSTWGGFKNEFNAEAKKKYLSKEKKSSVQDLIKEALTLPPGMANMAGKAMSAGKAALQNPAVKKTVGKGALALGGSSVGKTLGVGAAMGAAGGALQRPGQGESRLGNMARGAAMGTGLAAGARYGVGAAAKSKGPVGNYIRSAALGA
jgi:hypothetical protein